MDPSSKPAARPRRVAHRLLWFAAAGLLLTPRAEAVNYEVYPGSAFYLGQLLDRSSWSFVAERCNGLYHHPVGFNDLTTAEEQAYAAHFTNRFALVEGDMGSGSTTGDVANLQRMTALGLTPVAAFVNRPSSNLAVWRQLVRNNAAQGAPSYEMLAPHRLDDSPLGWYDPARDYARANLLVPGCIGSGVDAPVHLYVNEGTAYRQTIHDLRDWSVANGKRFNYLVSPNNSYGDALLADTQFVVRDLEDKGHEPDVYGVVLYGERPVDLAPEKVTIGGLDQAATTITGLAYYLIKHRDGEPGSLDLSARRDNVDHGAGVVAPTLANSLQRIVLPTTAPSTWTIRMRDTSPWLDYAGVLRARTTGATGDWRVGFANGGSDLGPQVLSERGRTFVGAERWMPGTTREVTLSVTPLVSNPRAFQLIVEALPHDGIDHALDLLAFQSGPPDNTPPTLSIEARPAITREALPLGPLWFTCGDAETESTALNVTAVSSNPTLLPASGLIFGRSGIQRWLRIVPATGQWGTANLTVTVSDGSLTKSTVLPITVERTTVLPLTKANNTINLEQGASWTGGKVPGMADQAVWDASVTGPNTTRVTTPLAVAGLRVTNPGGGVAIEAAAGLALGVSGVDLSTATRDLDLSGTILLDEAATWTIASGRVVRASGLSGPGGLTKAGNGRLDLAGSDTFAAALGVTAGEVVKTGPGAQSATSVSGNAVLRVSHSAGFGNGGLAVGAANSSTGRVELSGNIAVLSGKSVTINTRSSDSDAIVSHGDNRIDGAISLSTGGSLCAISSQAGTLGLGGTLSSIATGSRSFTLRGAASGIVTGTVSDGSATLGITKRGAGRWTLAGNHAFTGPVLVQEGHLVVERGLPTQAVTVATGAVLGGSAPLGGPVAVAGSHAPGNGVGSQRVDGPLSYLAGSSMLWELGSHTAVADAVDADAVVFDGSSRVEVLAHPTGGSVDYADPFWREPRRWVVVAARSITGAPGLGPVSADSTGKPAAPFGTWRLVADPVSIALAWTPGDPYDAWCYSQFGDSWNLVSLAGLTADPDADGWTNRDEWIAGTVATDRDSRFTVVPEGRGISFARTAGRSYEVLTAVDPTGPWLHHANVPIGTGRITIAAPPNSGPRRFYRVVIRVVP